MNLRNMTLAAAAGFTIFSAHADPLVGYDATTARWYRVVRVAGGIDWNTARNQADATGGSLAVITSLGEQALISTVAVDARGLWLGGQQNLGAGEPAQGWNWLTSEPFTFTNWALGEPNNNTASVSPPANEDRLLMSTVSGQWNDFPALFASPDLTKGYVLELFTPPAPIVWTGNGNGYLFVLYRAPNADVGGGLTWDEANTIAGGLTWQGRTGHLVTVTSAAEWAFITGTVGLDMRAGLWMGGVQMDAGPEPAGGWMWVNGEPWSFTAWLPGVPDDNRAFFPLNNNENRLITGSATGDWNDLSHLDNRPADTKGFIVEFDAPVVACGSADVGSQGGTPGPDGLLNNNDFIVYISRFFAGNAAADVGRQGGLPGSDGLFNNNDFIVFIGLFFAGC